MNDGRCRSNLWLSAIQRFTTRSIVRFLDARHRVQFSLFNTDRIGHRSITSTFQATAQRQASLKSLAISYSTIHDQIHRDIVYNFRYLTPTELAIFPALPVRDLQGSRLPSVQTWLFRDNVLRRHSQISEIFNSAVRLIVPIE